MIDRKILKMITKIAGGYKPIAKEMKENESSLKSKLNGYSLLSDDFVDKLMRASLKFGVADSVKSVDKTIRAFERRAGINLKKDGQ